MQLKNLPWPISVLHPTQILKAGLQKPIKSIFLIIKKDSWNLEKIIFTIQIHNIEIEERTSILVDNE